MQACGGFPADSGDHGQVQDPHVRGGNQRGQCKAVVLQIRIGSGSRKAKMTHKKKKEVSFLSTVKFMNLR